MDESYLFLTDPIQEHHTSVADIVRDGRQAWVEMKCEKVNCSNQRILTHEIFLNLPNILMVCINRFRIEFDAFGNMVAVKITQPITPSDSIVIQGIKYILRSFICHFGANTIAEGHYIGVIKLPDNGKFKYKVTNDLHITHDNENHLDGYVFFYEKDTGANFEANQPSDLYRFRIIL